MEQENSQESPPVKQQESFKHEKIITPLNNDLQPEDNTIRVASSVNPQPVVSEMQISPTIETNQQTSSPVNNQQPTDNITREYNDSSFAWLKIALAGLVISIVISFAIFALSLSFDFVLGKTLKHGVFNLTVVQSISRFYLILLILCACSYVVLSKRYVLRFSGYLAKRPLLISISTFIFITLCYVFIIKASSFSLEQLVTTGTVDHMKLRQFIADTFPYAFTVLSTLFLPLFTFLIEKLKFNEKYRFAIVSAVLMLPILATVLSQLESSASTHSYDVAQAKSLAAIEKQEKQQEAQQKHQVQTFSQNSAVQNSTTHSSTPTFVLYLPADTAGLSLSGAYLANDQPGDQGGLDVLLKYNDGNNFDTSNIMINEYAKTPDFQPPHCDYSSPGTSDLYDSCQQIGQTTSGQPIYFDESDYWCDFGGTVINIDGMSSPQTSEAIEFYNGMQATTAQALNLQ